MTRCLAFQLSNALLVAFDQHGFAIGKQDSWHRTTLTVLGESIGLSMDEQTRRVERTNPTPQLRWQHVPTGKLRFLIEHRGTKSIVEDRAELPLEEQLNAIVIALVRVAIAVARPQRLADEEAERQRAEYERQQRISEERRTRFEAAFKAWNEYNERRAFVDMLQTALPHDATDAAREFVAWTKRYLAASEPLGKLCGSFANDQPPQYRQFTNESYRRW